MMSLLLRLLLLLLLGISSCSALHEDQVGMWDWHQQYIGRVSHAAFQTQGSGRKRVVVATEKSVISSLNLRTGEIFWRQVVEESEPVDGLEIALGKYAVSLSRGGYLRSWNLPDGALIWETLLEATSSPSKLFTVPTELGREKPFDLVVTKGASVYAVSSADGRIIWKADLQDERLLDLSVSFEDSSVYAGGLSESSLALFRIDPATGAVTKLETDGAVYSSSGFVLSGGFFAALDMDEHHILTGDMKDGTIQLQKTSLSTLIPSEAIGSRISFLPAKIHGACILSVDGSLYVLELQKGKLNVIQKITEPAAVSDDISLGEGGFGFAVIQHLNPNEVAVNVRTVDGLIESAKEAIQLTPQRGSIQKVFLNAYTRTDRTRGFRVLVVGQDDSLSLLQQGKVVWTREDGLASIEDTVTAELPLEKSGGTVAEVEHDLAEWLKGHMLRLKSTLMLANAEDLAALQALRLNSAEKTKMVRDHNGFRKLIVVLTSSGKLFALHSGDGRVVWSHLLSNFRRGTLQLYPWKVPHRHSLDESPVALVLGSSADGSGAAAWVDMRTGNKLGSLDVPYSISQVLALPLIDSLEQRLHLFIDEDNKAHLYPATDETLELFEGYVQNVFFYLADKNAGLLEGFGLKSHVETSEQLGHVFVSQKQWSVVFPKETEVIAATATRRPDEVVHTQSKVLGNRDVWYKYLNKNMLFVATVTPQDSKAVNPEETWLVAYLIDSVTGHVLHRVSHSYGMGPVHAVFSENWVVYYYFNVRSQRHEMSVLEAYDKSAQDGKDVLQIMLGRYNASVPFSSFSSRTLDIKGQSYSFSSTVKAMTVTATGKGITGKQVLVGTLGNQVIALDKRFFDPRRTLAPTPGEREEGIIPLSEGLPIFPQSYLSHAIRIEGLKGILSVPARLESTCLVFAHGIDLFFTRTAPSRTYDSLTEDFSYALLLITIAALVVAIAVTMVLAERKELHEKWR